MNHCKHDPGGAREVWFTCVPKPQVTDDDGALLDSWLRRWSLQPPVREKIGLDPPTCSLAVLALLIRDRRRRMAAKPDFGTAVLLRHLDKRHVDNEGEGALWVYEIGIRVHRL